MKLSKETVDLIQKEADKIYKYYPLAVEKNAYIKGCETWAIWKEKAEGYEKALNAIIAIGKSKINGKEFATTEGAIAKEVINRFIKTPIMTPIQKAKEIIDRYGEYLVKEFKNEPSVDKWLATPQAAAILLGEDWISEIDKARFWVKAKVDLDYCWEWIGQLNKDGYGVFRTYKKIELAHRVAFKIIKGLIPDTIGVLHKCDNPKCVNPDHLFTGTHADNMKDKARKGRGKLLGRSSKYRGVSIRNDNNKWRATIKTDGKNISLGCYATQEEAAKKYDEKVIEMALDLPLNFPLPEPPKP